MGTAIKRRLFLSSVSCGLLGLPHRSQAQDQVEVHRIFTTTLKDGSQFRDAIILSYDQYAKMSEQDIKTLENARVSQWEATQAAIVTTAPTVADLQDAITSLAAQIAILAGRKTELEAQLALLAKNPK